ncbi:hypothetical protein QR680_003841 [Steinernema hermaphroditum]|uniref:Uncharacterized protein n=1 Tax=Steinernema hermaphroditum TaxID=289476 RepID=A0AA39LS88_9BILA|nr:hypothetical protein QR680_003841 [Steinernema hermaphroditum]
MNTLFVVLLVFVIAFVNSVPVLLDELESSTRDPCENHLMGRCSNLVLRFGDDDSLVDDGYEDDSRGEKGCTQEERDNHICDEQNFLRFG